MSRNPETSLVSKRVLAGLILAVVTASGAAARPIANADASYLPGDLATAPSVFSRAKQANAAAVLVAAAQGEKPEEYNLTVKFNESAAPAKAAVDPQPPAAEALAPVVDEAPVPVADGVPAADGLALSGDDHWVAIASVEELDQAIIIAQTYAEQKSRVVKARNGWFAVVLGPTPTSKAATFRNSYDGPELPAKILLTRGTDYMATVWPAQAEKPPAKPVDETAVAALANEMQSPAVSDAADPPVEQTASANPVDDPDAAYDRGDYATALKLWKQNLAARPNGSSGESAAVYLPPEKLALEGDERWVAIASVEDAGPAIEIARAFSDQKSRVVKARNGWFAVVLGPVPTSDLAAFRKTYSGPELPPGIILARGTDYLESVWPAATGAAEASPPPAEAHVVAAVAPEPIKVDPAPVEASVAPAEVSTTPTDASPVPADVSPASVEVAAVTAEASAAPVENDQAAAVPFRPVVELEPLAGQGDAAAQNTLGVAYVKGEGVPQDYVLAHMWFNLAAAQGNEDARQNRDGVAKLMTPDQIAEAQRLARQWKPVVAAQ